MTVSSRIASPEERRLPALWRFAAAITVLNLVGHAWLGFEQAWLHPLVAVAAACAAELLLECVAAWSSGRAVGVGRTPREIAEFLLSAYISGLAVAMLLYANERYWVVAFAASLAICSKHLFRIPTAGGGEGAGRTSRHFLNPSNFAITLTLLLFPWVGIAPPYQFTENVDGVGDWVLPAVLVAAGTLLNWRFTGRLPLIAAWLACFALQAVVRHAMTGGSLAAGLVPATGVAFLLFTFYMVSDPATTPTRPLGQVVFGSSVAIVYGVLMHYHVVFGFFFALTIVSGARGLLRYAVVAAGGVAELARQPSKWTLGPASGLGGKET